MYKKILIFIEKPITNNLKNYLSIKKLIKSKLIFVHYQHIYSDSINFLVNKLKKKILSIDLFLVKMALIKKLIQAMNGFHILYLYCLI